jgi:hypothetical protein
MSKQLRISHNGKTYTLEYTRKSVEILERQGFTLDDLTQRPATAIPMLFRGAFLANHSSVKRDVIDEIYEKLPNKAELIQKLAEMYYEPINGLFEESDGAEGNATWEVSW